MFHQTHLTHQALVLLAPLLVNCGPPSPTDDAPETPDDATLESDCAAGNTASAIPARPPGAPAQTRGYALGVSGALGMAHSERWVLSIHGAN